MKIKNWHLYQHYHKRNPPWIKLHFSILSSEDWVTLDDASRLLAIVCMLVASKFDGEIPKSATPEYFKRLAYFDKLPNFKPLIDCGFLIETLAGASECERLQATARPEQSREEKKDIVQVEPDRFAELWLAYPKRQSRKTAIRAYVKALREVSHETIMVALEKSKRSDSRFREMQFTPLLASWLNAGGWADESNQILTTQTMGIV